MGGQHGETIVGLVEAALESLKRLGEALRDGGADTIRTRVHALEDDAGKLHGMLETVRLQRVLQLSFDQLMEAGIVLYNSSRSVFKTLEMALERIGKGDVDRVRFPLLFVRLMAARVMGLALSCSQSEDTIGSGRLQDQSVFVDDCLDVLRSYGRIGSLLFQTASVDSRKCSEYLTLSNDAFENANKIWNRVGLACLTRFKQDVELEEILQDLWDFSFDRIRVLRSLEEYSHAESLVNSIVEALHELQLLIPYSTNSGETLVRLVQDILADWKKSGRYSDLVTIGDEALRLCDSIGVILDAPQAKYLEAFKHRVLVDLLWSLGCLGDIDRAEVCFSLLGKDRDPSAVLTMLKLYLKTNQQEKASLALKCLLQQDDLLTSMAGARAYVEANGFSEDSIQVFKQLDRHYGDHTMEISIELACCLANSGARDNRQRAIEEFMRIAKNIKTTGSQLDPMLQQLHERMRQTIHDATLSTLNDQHADEGLLWAELGMDMARSPEESAFFMRVLAASFLKLGSFSDSWKWANDAVNTDSSKASLLSLFEASLMIDDACTHTTRIIDRLKAKDDFKDRDLISFGSAAHDAGRDDVCLELMNDMCSILVEKKTVITEVPLGVLLQNTAQLALQMITTAAPMKGTEASASYAPAFTKYSIQLIESAQRLQPHEVERFGSESVFVWFYAMSFNIARTCKDAILFIRAGDISSEAARLFGEASTLSGRELECLIAALSVEMTDIESLDGERLQNVNAVIARAKVLVSNDDDNRLFLSHCELAARLRGYDSDVERIKQICHDELPHHFETLLECGELILHASRFSEANEIRTKYRILAGDFFKHSLQLLLQGESYDTGKLSYIFRRLIVLSGSRHDALQWFDQLVQLVSSVDVQLSDSDAEWFIAKAWNMGVQQHRNQVFDESQRFMKLAFSLLSTVGSSLTGLGQRLHEQYQALKSLEVTE